MSVLYLGQLESTMLNHFTRAGKLKRWLARPDCPPFLKECKEVFDKAFGSSQPVSGTENIANSAFESVPMDLKHLFPDPKIALRARHRFDDTLFSRASTHVGNSLVLYYPAGDHSKAAVPGSIQNIVVKPNKDVVYVVRRQLPLASNSADPFRFYPHFLAKSYSKSLSPKLELVRPEWVISHYARWTWNEDSAVVLTLSRVRFFRCLLRHIFSLFFGLRISTLNPPRSQYPSMIMIPNQL